MNPQKQESIDESTATKATSYKEYHKSKVKRRQKSRKNSRLNVYESKTCYFNDWSDIHLLFTAEYCANRFNWLRLIVLVISFILLFICILYCVGSVLTLELDDFWCDDYSWRQIINYNKLNNQSQGVGGCYISQKLSVDDTKLFATGNEENALVVTPNFNVPCIIKSVLYGAIALGLLLVIIKYIWICFKDCQHVVNDELYVKLKCFVCFFIFGCCVDYISVVLFCWFQYDVIYYPCC